MNSSRVKNIWKICRMIYCMSFQRFFTVPCNTELLNKVVHSNNNNNKMLWIHSIAVNIPCIYALNTTLLIFIHYLVSVCCIEMITADMVLFLNTGWILVTFSLKPRQGSFVNLALRSHGLEINLAVYVSYIKTLVGSFWEYFSCCFVLFLLCIFCSLSAQQWRMMIHSYASSHFQITVLMKSKKRRINKQRNTNKISRILAQLNILFLLNVFSPLLLSILTEEMYCNLLLWHIKTLFCVLICIFYVVFT